MPDCVLAIDAGTTRIRALLIDGDGSVVGRAAAAAAIAHPAPGRVEQSPEQLWQTTRALAHTVLAEAGLAPADVAAVGVTAQRGNVVVWRADSGAPLAPLVSWQDLRGVARASELAAQGFLLSHQCSAAKLESVLGEIERGYDRFNDGTLLWGNLDTYLAWRLSGGTMHATDHGQACATGYYDYLTGAWNDALIGVQRLDPARFPRLVDSIGTSGITAASVFGAERPIAALLADQQSAAIAQGCLRPGITKVSYGTSATLDCNTGGAMKLAAGCYPMVLYKHGDARTFCIEGMVNTAGAMIDWAIEGLGIAASPAELSALAASVDDSGGAYVLPALQGLGTPHGDASRRGLIGGLTRATSRAQIAHAVLESIAWRVREAADAVMLALDDAPRMTSLRADGGASRSDCLVQLQADALGLPVERLAIAEATAFGAATAAACGVGLRPLDDPARRRTDAVFEPRWSDDTREGRFVDWQRHCGIEPALAPTVASP
jgi:glycerol kinase